MSTTTADVRDLYEQYPYPPVEQPLGFPLLASIDYVRCVLWPRRRSLEGLRVLDAGCGTGHVAVEMASRYPDVEVVGIDLSAAALTLARRRAERAGVRGNLTFREGTVEELATQDLGARPFDYIVSSGVLHHLVDPTAGARALSARLAPDGALGLMVYAPHGRHGVYVLQELLRRLVGDRPLPEQIAAARAVLSGLPADHPFRAEAFADQSWVGDAGLVDLLLHVKDRSYTVPELRELLASAGLQIDRFVLPYLYRPETYLKGVPPLRAPRGEDSAAIAELLAGTMRMHVALVRHASFRPDVVSPDAPVARPMRSPLLRWAERQVSKPAGGEARRGPSGIKVRELTYTGQSRDLNLEHEPALVLERCDGERTFDAIFEDPEMAAALGGQNDEQKRRRLRDLLAIMVQQDLGYLLG